MDLDQDQAMKHAYYSAEDCAGLLRRITAVAVDLLALLVLLIPFAFAVEVLGVVSLLEGPLPRWFIVANFLFAYLYLTALKRWWTLGPINPLMDMFFISNNDQRQTIRDKLMGTYVIRMDAQPAGYGHRTMGSFSFMRFMFLFPTVVPDDARR